MEIEDTLNAEEEDQKVEKGKDGTKVNRVEERERERDEGMIEGKKEEGERRDEGVGRGYEERKLDRERAGEGQRG